MGYPVIGRESSSQLLDWVMIPVDCQMQQSTCPTVGLRPSRTDQKSSTPLVVVDAWCATCKRCSWQTFWKPNQQPQKAASFAESATVVPTVPLRVFLEADMQGRVLVQTWLHQSQPPQQQAPLAQHCHKHICNSLCNARVWAPCGQGGVQRECQMR